MTARRFYIEGLVQGVGYRYFAQRSAARHQVRGYVKNLDDGRVEVHVEAELKAVDEFKKDLAAGPAFAEVENIEEIVIDSTGLYSTFRIER